MKTTHDQVFLDSNDIANRRVEELLQKRERGEASCAECKRSKVKCDRKIPCTRCQEKNCPELCPHENLKTNHSTRFILSATMPLYRRIRHLNNRISRLEEVLTDLQSQNSSEPHPVLHHACGLNDNLDTINDADSLAVPSRDNDLASVVDTFGTLSISKSGTSRYIGATAGCETLLQHSEHLIGSSQVVFNQAYQPSSASNLDDPLLFSSSFPFHLPADTDSNVQRFIELCLPPIDQAIGLFANYLDNFSWISGTVSSSQLTEEILPMIYHFKPEGESFESNNKYYGPHDLALVFIVLAIGSLVVPSTKLAEHFHQLAQVALILQPVLERPSLATLQTLFLMGDYKAMAAGNSGEYERGMQLSWSLKTMTAHLALAMGLHRYSASWGLLSQTIERRDAIFWNIFRADMFESLNNGRPPQFSMSYIDCNLPSVKHGNSDSQCHNIQWRISTDIVSKVTTLMFGQTQPDYAAVLEMDEEVRNYSLCSEDEDSEVIASHLYYSMKRIVLLFLHRVYFATAIIEHPDNPFKSQYAASFLASYRTASDSLKSIGEFFNRNPRKCAQLWMIWRHAFSSAVVIGLIAAKYPQASWAKFALVELEKACGMFEEAAEYNVPITTRAFSILVMLREKGRDAIVTPQKVPMFGCFDSKQGTPDLVDELLLILSGHRRLYLENSKEQAYPASSSYYTKKISEWTQGSPTLRPHYSGLDIILDGRCNNAMISAEFMQQVVASFTTDL